MVQIVATRLVAARTALSRNSRHIRGVNWWTGATAASLLVATAAGIGATGQSRTFSEAPDKGQDGGQKQVGKDGDGGKIDTSDSSKEEGNVFDIAKEWMGDMKTEGSNFLEEYILVSKEEDERKGAEKGKDGEGKSKGLGKILDFLFRKKDDSSSQESRKEQSESAGFMNLAETFTSLVSVGEPSKDATTKLIQRARESTDAGDVEDKRSFWEITDLFDKTLKEIQKTLEDSFGHLDFSNFDPTAIFYFLELEDERKNPSWKRMMHRYHRGVDMRKVNELNEALYMAKLGYADSVDQVKKGLKKAKDQWELLYFDKDSYPGQPSHFLALKKGQSRWSSELEVLLVVRGTKTVPDLFTDALLDSDDYRGGKAHAGIVRSGKYLVEKHSEMLENLRSASKKRKVKLTLIGHSLGAGAASIAGMEFNDINTINASVVGFGCPALLSKDLSESTADYITTVVGDSDIIPRMSGATIANIALDIMEYDWTPKGRRDVEQALNELKANSPIAISESSIDYAMGLVDSAIEKYIKPRVKSKTTERMEPVLFPPGSCIHFYRDGSGISGSYAPCTFFNEIDITRTMIDDHTIGNGYSLLFLELMRSYHRDRHFAFDLGVEDN